MKQKGFTLAELIGVIVVLAMISLVAVPAVTTSLNKYKYQLCTTQLNNIEAAAKTWGADNLVMLPDKDGNSIKVTLGTLSEYGYIDEEIENPITKENFDLKNTYVTITRTGKKLKYVIDSNSEASCSKDKETGSGDSSGGTGSGDTSTDEATTLCRSAQTLHVDSIISSITYGSIPEGTEDALKSGDAFDCDVNGDGTYDSQTERFYYVSGLNGDSNSNTAVLIYYNNTIAGEPLDDYDQYLNYSSDIVNGTTSSLVNLPTKQKWGALDLIGTRTVLSRNLELSRNLDYGDKVARLITYSEVVSSGCVEGNAINNCDFLKESATNSSSRYCLETPSPTYEVYYINPAYGSLSLTNEPCGVRPAIEVDKSQLGLTQ